MIPYTQNITESNSQSKKQSYLPGCSVVTPSPMDSTIPPPSWPKTHGKSPSGSLPPNV